MTARRHIVPLLAALAVASGCGGERQDADEPERAVRLEVTQASFPESQRIAEQSTLRIRVRNADQRAAPNVAVTIQTGGETSGAKTVAFSQPQSDPRLADPNRPVWVVDDGPVGGTSAYANSWSLGELRPGESKTFTWKVTAVEAGDYTIDYSVAPGLDGKATLASGSDARGSFEVSISREPIPARVTDSGEVVRGEEAGAGAD